MPITEMHINERRIFNARILPTYSLVSSFCRDTFLISIVLKPKSVTIKQIPAKEYANENLPKSSSPNFLAIYINKSAGKILVDSDRALYNIFRLALMTSPSLDTFQIPQIVLIPQQALILYPIEDESHGQQEHL